MNCFISSTVFAKNIADLWKAISGLSPKPIGDIRRCVYDVFENFFSCFHRKMAAEK